MPLNCQPTHDYACFDSLNPIEIYALFCKLKHSNPAVGVSGIGSVHLAILRVVKLEFKGSEYLKIAFC